MPVTQRFVHGGLALAAGLLSLCVVVLILGASRETVNHAGLPGAMAPAFALRDVEGAWYKSSETDGKIRLLVIAPAKAEPQGQQRRQLQQVSEVCKADPDVTMLGIQYFDSSFDVNVGGSRLTQPPLHNVCPELPVLNDIDRSVANAFRVTDSQPVVFVIDSTGIIRGRIPLGESAAIAVSEMIASLKTRLPSQDDLGPRTG